MLEETMSVAELRDLLEQGSPATVLDIRRAADRAEWYIPGSFHQDTYGAGDSSSASSLGELELPREAPVVTVCRSGVSSLAAAEQLRRLGYRARSLAGGMKAWSLAWNSADVLLPGSPARVIQLRRTGKGCLSYLVGADGEAAVIDASIDPAVYVDLAAQQGWRIAAVLDTHVHADHLSRSRRLAELTGARLYLPEESPVSYPFAPLHEGQLLELGAGRLAILHTPGHTMESAAYLLDGVALFTGDTLFLKGVGRPDLEGTATEAEGRARALHRSLQRLLALPDETLVLPAHTAEPIDFDHQPVSARLADVRRQNQGLVGDGEAFVRGILARVPPTPPNHRRIIELNREGLLPDDPAELEAGANRCAIS